ncbi:hypothetical protein N7488_004490 [Penicillium malachiteum]|nr:hypothetical protein N7488_004490 [Penicillium malachiteum]
MRFSPLFIIASLGARVAAAPAAAPGQGVQGDTPIENFIMSYPQDHHNEKDERGENIINIYSSYNTDNYTAGEGSTTANEIRSTPSIKVYSTDSND